MTQWFVDRWIEPNSDEFVVFDRNGIVRTTNQYERRIAARNDSGGPCITTPKYDRTYNIKFISLDGVLIISDLDVLIKPKYGFATILNMLETYTRALQERRERVMCLLRSRVHCLARHISEFF